MTLPKTAVAVALILASATPSFARFDCGRVQRAYFHIRDRAFNLALHWAVLPHTYAHPGAVVVQTRRGRALGGSPGGHVSRIISITGSCTAIVADEKGQYNRNICRNLVAYVDPTARKVAQGN